MPTTTAVFKFIPGEEIGYAPEQDSLIGTLPVFATNGVTITNKVSDTIDVGTSTRTVVREWASNEVATEFVAALQTLYTETGDSIPGPLQLISVQINS